MRYILRIAGTVEAMTKPTNVLLDEALRAVAKRRAAERGLSVSGYIRELIRSDDRAARVAPDDLGPLIGILGDEGEPTDIARQKHALIAQAFNDGFDSTRPGGKAVE